MGIVVSSSHVVSAAPSSSPSSPAPARGPSHGRQLSTNCPNVGPPRGHKPCQKTCSGVGSSLHGSTGPGRTLLQCGLPTGSQPPSGIHLLRCGVLPRLQADICTSLGGLQGAIPPHRGLLHGLLMDLALASGGSVLERVALAPSHIGEASSSFSHKPPL